MQRTLCRILRTSCSSKLKEETSPILATEDIHHQQSKNKENCRPPPTYTVGDAIGWTTSLVVTYEFVHRRHKKFGEQDRNNDFCSLSSHPSSFGSRWTSYLKYCPFGLARLATTQPIVGVGIPSTARNIQSVSTDRRSSTSPSSSPLSKSIDTTPFLKENESLFFPTTFRTLSQTLVGQQADDDEDDGGIQFDASITKFDEAKSRRPSNSQIVYFAEKLIGDIYSALGAFKFLNAEKQDNTAASAKSIETTRNSSVSSSGGILVNPMELFEKGVALGSGRALYNIGVAYDRMHETNLAREYYQKAADVGHPLATYNIAVFSFKDGKIFEGLRLMTYAAENGVDEATEVLNLIV